MPRAPDGTYTLPAGNPVVSGTVIDSVWANTTMADIGAELTDSLSRSGKGGMQVAFQNADGTEASPGITWGSEPTTGFYRAAGGDQRMSLLGQDLMRWNSGVTSVWDGAAWRALIYTTGPAAVGALTATSANFGGGIVKGSSVEIISTAINYSVTAADYGVLILTTAPAAMTITVPLEATLALNVGMRIEVSQQGAGAVTFLAEVGATIISADGRVEMAHQYSAATLTKVATNTWLLVGDLV